MKEKDKQFLEDFVEGTRLWLKTIKEQDEIAYKLELKQCAFCGVNFKKMEKLAKIIKSLITE